MFPTGCGALATALSGVGRSGASILYPTMHAFFHTYYCTCRVIGGFGNSRCDILGYPRQSSSPQSIVSALRTDVEELRENRLNANASHTNNNCTGQLTTHTCSRPLWFESSVSTVINTAERRSRCTTNRMDDVAGRSCFSLKLNGKKGRCYYRLRKESATSATIASCPSNLESPVHAAPSRLTVIKPSLWNKF